jgi:hypothetical protein
MTLDGKMFYFTSAAALGSCRCTSNFYDENVEVTGMRKEYKRKGDRDRGMKGIKERRRGDKG